MLLPPFLFDIILSCRQNSPRRKPPNHSRYGGFIAFKVMHMQALTRNDKEIRMQVQTINEQRSNKLC